MRQSQRGGARITAWAALAALTFGWVVVEPLDAQETSTSSARALKYELQPPPANFSPPILSIDSPTYNWGSVLRGDLIKHSFKVRNTGGSVLKINVRPSCGCTAANYDKEIPPGGEGSITLQIDTKRFSGHLTKTAAVHTNADQQPTQLTLTGDVTTPLKIEPAVPPQIQVIRGLPSKPIELTVTKNTTQDLTVTGVEVEPTKIFTAELTEVVAGSRYKLTVSANDPADSKPFYSADVTVMADMGGKSVTVPVHVTAAVKDRIQTAPRSVYFGRSDTDKFYANEGPVTKDVTIMSLDPSHKFKITKIESPGVHFKTSVEPIDDGSTKYKLVVTLIKGPEDNTRRVSEDITIHTDDPLVPTILLRSRAAFSIAPATAR